MVRNVLKYIVPKEGLILKKYVKLKFKKELAEISGIKRTLEGHLPASRKTVLTP